MNQHLMKVLPIAFFAMLVAAKPAEAFQTGAPAAPTNCRAVLTQFWGFIYTRVSWVDNSSNEDGFTIEWKSRAGITSHDVPADSSIGTAGVEPGGNAYRVRAFNAYGVSAWSNSARVTYHPDRPDPGGGGGVVIQSASPKHAQSFTFQTVDAPGRDHSVIQINSATRISETGLIVQQYYGPDAPVGLGHTAVLQNGVWTVIDVPGSVWCAGSNANARGQVALAYATADGVVHQAIWQRGSYRLIPDLTGHEVWAKLINNRGQVVGPVWDPLGKEHGFVRDADGYTFFDHPLASPGTAAFSVNDVGTVVGWYDAPDGSIQSFLWDGDTFDSIAPPGSIFSFATSINDAGVVGGMYIDAAFNFHGFVLRSGVYTTIDFPGAMITKIDSITNRGEISGEYITFGWEVHGFVARPIPGG